MQATAFERPAAFRFPTGAAFDYATAIAALWLLAGLHLDGWAHAHRPKLESFFTIWHGALYSGFFALAAVIVLGAWARRREGLALGELRLSMIGVGVFFLGGVGDMI